MHTGKKGKQFKYFMAGNELEHVETEKDLGVWISSDLKSSNQCVHAYQKANRILGMINRTITWKSADILLPLYKTLVRPLLEYCTVAWSPHYVKDKSLLERIQHRFTRMVPGLKNKSYEERLQQLGLWTLEERRNRADLIEVFKILNGLTTIPFDELFEVDISGRTRGHSVKLRKNRCKLDVRKYFFCDRVVNRWNNLDEKTIGSTSVNEFKRNLQRLRDTRMGLFNDYHR